MTKNPAAQKSPFADHPSPDEELRMRCIEAASNVVTMAAGGGEPSKDVAGNALGLAEAFYKFAKEGK